MRLGPGPRASPVSSATARGRQTYSARAWRTTSLSVAVRPNSSREQERRSSKAHASEPGTRTRITGECMPDVACGSRFGLPRELPVVRFAALFPESGVDTVPPRSQAKAELVTESV